MRLFPYTSMLYIVLASLCLVGISSESTHAYQRNEMMISHTVRPGETLQRIISRYYDNLSSVKTKELRKMIVSRNPHAFRSGNPHFIYANSTIKIPEKYNDDYSSERPRKHKKIYYFSK